MKYIYIDESGSPSIKNGGSHFYVAMVIFDSLDTVLNTQNEINRLKAVFNIPSDYEFHFSRNAIKNKRLFIEFIKTKKIDNEIIRIRKSDNSNCIATAADQLTKRIKQFDDRVNIRMDSNPILFDYLRKALRREKVHAKISEVKSKTNSLVQIADYCAGMAAWKEKLKKLPHDGSYCINL